MEIKITNRTIGRWLLIYIPTLMFGVSIYKYGFFSNGREFVLVHILQFLYFFFFTIGFFVTGFALTVGKIEFYYTISLPKFGPDPFDENHKDWDDYQDFLRNRD